MTATFGCVVLTQGSRPDDLRLALESLLAQRDVDLDVVVVGSGWEPTGLPDRVRGVAVEPVFAAAGRNAGVPHVRGELLFFLDDDASLAAPDALAAVARRFQQEPELGLLQLAVAPREGGPPLRSWVPRVRVGDRARDSDVTAVWEGAVAARRSVFEAVGGWPEEFGMLHEGVDLAWRVIDAGNRVRYAGAIVALHPSHRPARHGYSHYLSARNRVWLVRRHLPLPLGAVNVVLFALRTLPRLRSRRDLREALRGYRDGIRQPCGRTRRLRARTLWRMTRAGRPPVL